MVSIVAGQGLGLHNTSAGVLGSQGQWGAGAYGQSGEQVVVNAATGNLVIRQQDEWLVGVGPDAVIGRTYNSLSGGVDDNADNWQLGLSRRIVGFTGSALNAAGSTVTRLTEDGHQEVYSWDAGRSAYVSKAGSGSFDTLTYANGAWTWTDGDSRTQETYTGTQSAAKLTRVEDAQGHQLRLSYAQAGNANLISRIESWAAGAAAASEWVVVEYQTTTGKTNNIASLTTHYRQDHTAGGAITTRKRVTYDYDNYNRLSKVVVDLTPEDGSTVDGKVHETRYTYDDAVTLGTKRLKTLELFSEASSKLEFTYQSVDGQFRVQQIRQFEGTTLKQQTTLDYSVTGQTSITDAMGQVTVIQYETAAGQNLHQVRKVTGPAVGGASQVQEFTYDVHGNVLSIKDARGQTTTFEYDTNGNRVLQRDAQHNVTRWHYDSSNRLLTQTSYRDLDPDGSGSAVQTDRQTTRYAYDGDSNRVRFVISPEGRVTEYVYNAAKQVATQIQYSADLYPVGALGIQQVPSTSDMVTWAAARAKTSWQRVDYAYDFRGQLDKQTRFGAVDASTGAGLLDGKHSTTQYVYDQSGRLLKQIDANGKSVIHHYDGLNRITLSTDELGRQTSTEYTDAQRQATVTLYSGLVRTTTYDVAGRILSVSQGTSSSLSGLGTTQYTHDKLGRLTRVVLPNGQTSYTLYDEAGRKTAEIDAEGGLTEYIYNANNQIQQSVRYASSVSTANRDLLNTKLTAQELVPVATIRPSTSSSGDRRQVMIYDLDGRLRYTVTATATEFGTSAASVVERRYDGAGRQVQQLAYATRLSNTNFNNIVNSTSEPVAGNGAITVRLSTNALSTITLASSTDDRLSQTLYDRDGLLVGSIDADQRYTAYQYDAAGRLSRTIRYAQAVQGTLAAAQVTPDVIASGATPPVGRAYVVRRDGSASNNLTESGSDQITRRIYDGQGRLTAALDAEGHVTTYTYRHTETGLQTEEVRHVNKMRTSTATGAVVLGRVHGEASTYYVVTSSTDQKLTTQYDALGRIQQLTAQPQGTITRYSYEDVAGVGLLTKVTVAADTTEARTTQVRRDLLGRVTAELSGEGSKALADAQAQNKPASEIEAIWQRHGTRHIYNQSGYRIATITPDGVNGAGDKTVYYYDRVGRLTHSINALGEVTSFTYNTAGDVTEERRYAQRLNPASYGGGLRNGTLTTAVSALVNDAQDRRVQWSYNRAGLMATRTDGGRSAQMTSYGYNAFGEQILRTEAVGQESGSSARQIMQTYDRMGRLTRTQVQSDAGVLLRQTSMRYDAFGRVIERTDGRGVISTQRYDRLGRTIYAVDPGRADSHQAWIYDAFGRVLSRSDSADQLTTYTYDDAARSMTVTTPEGISTVTRQNRHGQTVEVQDGRGHVTRYQYNADGNLTQTSVHSGGAASALAGTTVTRSYDDAGRLKLETSAQGKSVSYTYDAASRVLTRAESGGGGTSAFVYDGVGNAVWSRDAAGVWTKSEYDNLGRLTALVLDPLQVPDASLVGANRTGQNTITLVANTASSPLNARTEFSYTLDGLTQRVTRGAGSSRPEVTEYSYDALGRRIQEMADPDGLKLRTEYRYDANDNVVLRKDALGHLTRYVYSDANQLTHTIDATGAVTRTDHDALGRISREVAYAQRISETALNNLGEAATQAQVAALLPTAIGERDQVSYRFYDKDSRLTLSLDALGYATARTYDAAGNLSSVTRYFNKPTGVDTTGSAQDGRLSFNRPTVVADTARDRTQHHLYDAANRQIWHIDALGYATQTTYTGGGGRIVTTTRYANQASYSAGQSAPTVVADSQKDQRTMVTLDTWGRESLRGDAEGYLHARQYDAVGRLKLEVRYSDASGGDADHASNVKTQYAYDAAGRLLQVTDAEGVITRYAYNAAGWRTQTTLAHGTSEASTTRYTHDAAGRLIEEVRAADTAEQSITRYELDAMGNQRKVIDPRGVEAAEGTSAWAVDERVRILGAGDRSAALAQGSANHTAVLAAYTTTLAYDKLGRVVRSTDALGGVTTNEYDAFGNKVKVVDPNGNAGYFYFDANNQATWLVDPMGYAVESRYGAFGQVQTIVRYANAVQGPLSTSSDIKVFDTQAQATTAGASVYILRDATKDATTTIEHDKLGRQLKITDAEGHSESMAYDGLGNKTSYTNKLGGTYTYTHDQLGRVLTETSPVTVKQYNAQGALVINNTPVAGQANTEWLVVTRFEYDERGNVTKKIEAQGLAEQRITQYTYDKLNRQTSQIGQAFKDYNPQTDQLSASDRIPVESRSYDKRGNLIEQKDANGNRTLHYYDALDRKVAQLSATGGLTLLDYDKAGNLIRTRQYEQAVSLPAQAGSTPPAAPSQGAVREVRYSYDARGRQTEQVTPGVVVYTKDGGARQADLKASIRTDATGNVIEVTDARGNKTHSFYDRTGNKVLEVDAMRYVTTWSHDAAGKAVRTTRYDTAMTEQALTSLLANRNVSQVSLAVLDAGKSRTVEYEYDRLGQLKADKRLGVEWSAIDAVTGDKTDKTSAADTTVVTRYTYNGLGGVLTQTDATGAVTSFQHDQLGRVIKQEKPGYVDYLGTSRKPTTEWFFNGLGQNHTEVVRGTDDTTDNDDRFTRYSYGANGLLLSETRDIDSNATSGPRTTTVSYQYDLAGNVTLRSQDRRDANAVIHTDRTRYVYDAQSRQIEQIQQSKTAAASSWTTLQSLQTRYNAFGDISARGTNNGWQEQVEFDAAGRVWRSNAGTEQGAVKVYYYDENGNNTLQLSSTTLNLQSSSVLPNASLSALNIALQDKQIFVTAYTYNELNQNSGRFETDVTAPVYATASTSGAADPFATGLLSGGSIRRLTYNRNGAQPVVLTEIRGLQALDYSKPVFFETIFTGREYTDIFAGTWRTVSTKTVLELRATEKSRSLALERNLNGFVAETVATTTSSGGNAPSSVTYYQLDNNGNRVSLASYQFPDGSWSNAQGWLGAELYKQGNNNWNVTIDGQNSIYELLTQGLDITVPNVDRKALTLEFKYRLKNASTDWSPLNSTRHSTTQGPYSSFSIDVSSLPLNEYEFEYRCFDGDRIVVAASGAFKQIENKQSIEYRWDGSSEPSHVGTIDLGRRAEIISISPLIASANRGLSERMAIAYNAFNEVIQKQDSLGAQTTFDYNRLGKLIRQSDPEVDIQQTGSGGVVSAARVTPTTRYYYDQVGRLVAVQDANGNLNTQTLLAGSTVRDPIIVSEFRADRQADGSGVKRNFYDVFGDLRFAANELWFDSRLYSEDYGDEALFYGVLYDYDELGQVVRATRRYVDTSVRQSIEEYEYDEVGNRIARILPPVNDIRGERSREHTIYDALGRVTETVGAGNISVRYEYAWDGAIAGGGGWRKTTYQEGKTLIHDLDTFGRLRWHKDLGQRAFAYRYNEAGLLVNQSNKFGDFVPQELSIIDLRYDGQDISYEYYENGLTKSISDNARQTWTKYHYDTEGRRAFEGYARNFGTAASPAWEYNQFSFAHYDAAGRVTRLKDPKSDIQYEYDAVGNKVRVLSRYNDSASASEKVQDYWYAYDKMNRFVISMGIRDAQGKVTLGSADSREITYDAAGQRKSEKAGVMGPTLYYIYEGYIGTGWLARITKSLSNYSDFVMYRRYDPRGNVVSQTEKLANNSQKTTKYVYDSGNRVLTQTESVGGVKKSETIMTYRENSRDLYRLKHDHVDGTSQDYTTEYTYEYWDTSKISEIKIAAGSKRRGYGKISYDINGHAERFRDDYDNRHFYYYTDADGRVSRREEFDGPDKKAKRNQTTTKVTFQYENNYFFNGKQVGNVSFMDGATPKDFIQAQAAREQKPGKRKPVSSADFDQSFVGITPDSLGKSPSSYTVGADGETLQSIARAVWGDGSLWYLIAEANSLFGNVTLSAGERLIIPNKVVNVHNNTTTSRPYDAAQAMGDTNPTLPPPPPPKKGCGGFGMVLMIVVAVAVAAVVGPAVVGALSSYASVGTALASGSLGGFAAGMAGAAAGAMAGSIASQAVGMVTGNVDKFSWSDVGRSAVMGMLSAGATSLANASGLYNINAVTGAATSTAGTMAQAAISSTLSQGAAMVLGLQKKFSWTAVAAAGVSAGVGRWAGESINASFGNEAFGAKGGQILRGTMAGVAGGAAAAWVSKDKPNWAAIAANSFGSALGDAVVGKIAGGERNRAQAKQDARNAQWFTLDPAGVGPNTPTLEDSYPPFNPDAEPVGTSTKDWRKQQDQLKLGELVERKSTNELIKEARDLIKVISDHGAVGRPTRGVSSSGEIDASELYRQGLGDIRERVISSSDAILPTPAVESFAQPSPASVLSAPIEAPQAQDSAPTSFGDTSGFIRDWFSGAGGTAGYSAVTGYDAGRRTAYKAAAVANSQEFMSQVRALNPNQVDRGAAIAEQAFDARQSLRTATQRVLSPGGKLISMAIEKPYTFAGQVAYRASSLAQKGAPYTQMDVYKEVIRASGSSNRWVSGLNAVTRVAGPLGAVVGIGASGYAIANAPAGQTGRVAAEEFGGFAGGLAGGMAATYAVGGLALGAAAVGLTVAAPLVLLAGGVAGIAGAVYTSARGREAGLYYYNQFGWKQQ